MSILYSYTMIKCMHYNMISAPLCQYLFYNLLYAFRSPLFEEGLDLHVIAWRGWFSKHLSCLTPLFVTRSDLKWQHHHLLNLPSSLYL